MKRSICGIMLVVSAIVCSCAPRSGPVSLSGDGLRDYQNAKMDYAAGSLDLAEKEFRSVAAKREDFFQARFMLGKAVYSQGRMAEAEKIFLDLVNKYPQYHEAEIWLVRSLMANTKTDEAVRRLEVMLAFDSGDPRLLALYAKLTALKGDAKNALQYLRMSVAFEEELAFSHFDTARYYYQFGLPDKALLEIDKCLLLLPLDHSLRRPVLELKNTIAASKEKTHVGK